MEEQVKMYRKQIESLETQKSTLKKELESASEYIMELEVKAH